ncbi:MAG: esterase family protein [Alicyclobacillus sp.]|nr:esterase family protein [Alicyclobacillus sp.]
MEAHQLYSVHLQEERTVKVYLPPGFRRDEVYPILYCHDGLEFFTHGRIATLANRMIAERKLQPLLIAGLAVNKALRTDDYAADGARSHAYRRFVAEECVPWVEAHYPVATGARCRFLAGVSLGAAASLLLHLEYPQVFQDLLLFSGAFYESAQAAVQVDQAPLPLRAWMVVGRQETAVATGQGEYDFLAANRKMYQALLRRGAQVDYREAEGTHIWGFWQREVPAALAWLASVHCHQWP